MRLEVCAGATGNSHSWGAGERAREECDQSRGQRVDRPVELSFAAKALRRVVGPAHQTRSPQAALRNPKSFELIAKVLLDFIPGFGYLQAVSDVPVIVSGLSSPQPSPIVAVRNLVKQFGRFAALRGVTAEFAPGRLYAILGDNGAGKTTLLRTLAGLIRPTRGSISLLGSKRCSCGLPGGGLHGASFAAL